ncbi:MAG TPA: hypothetical protein PKY31_04125 [Spirochaetota bacterium]|nr:hypothetical protein [Spirochaetota bacterium]
MEMFNELIGVRPDGSFVVYEDVLKDPCVFARPMKFTPFGIRIFRVIKLFIPDVDYTDELREAIKNPDVNSREH